MAKINNVKLASGLADASGDATATTKQIIRGLVHAVKLAYSAGSATPTDVTVTDSDGQTLLSFADSATPKVHYPRVPVSDVDGTDVTYDGSNEIYDRFVVAGTLTITVANQTENKEVTATILVEEQ